MSIQSIEDAKVLKKYCDKLGREGMTARIVELAKEIVESPLYGQKVMEKAGMIRAICTGAKCDGYWDEKQEIGRHKMVWEARENNIK